MGDALFMNARTFQDRMKFIKDKQYNVIDMNEAVRSLELNDINRSLVITIDDGWYSAYKEMYPVLKKFNLKATLYCDTQNLMSSLPISHVMVRYIRMLSENKYIGNNKILDSKMIAFYKEMFTQNIDFSKKIDNLRAISQYLSVNIDSYLESRAFSYMLPEHIREMHLGGIDIQLHTHSHTMGDFNEAMISQEIERNRLCLCEILNCNGSDLKHFCYPSGRYSNNIDVILKKNDIESATTCERDLACSGHSHYFLPRILDGENLSMIEFEAELCGFLYLFRKLRRVMRCE